MEHRIWELPYGAYDWDEDAYADEGEYEMDYMEYLGLSKNQIKDIRS